MKQYKQLTSEQRYQIYGLKQAGLDQTQIAQKMGVDKSTISREFSRNQGQRGWRPKQAQVLRDERKQACRNGRQFASTEWAEVERLVRGDLSPEQTASRLALEGALQISHETIYRYIYADKREGGDLHRHLRSQKPRRKLLRPHKHRCHTITFDNGKEFAGHERIAAELGASIYFAHPYCSWERGLNENSNGLLRQYFPKGMALINITEGQVQRAVERLNHRPRKVLGFRSPHEVLFGVVLRYTKTPRAVALRT